MRTKTIYKACSALMSVALLITSVPPAAQNAAVHAAEAAKDATQDSLLKLWYNQPASKGSTILSAGSFSPTAEDNRWQQLTLPIGNSFMGANVYGEIANERLTFNQKTLWSGGPSESRPNYNGGNKSDMSGVYRQVVDAFLSGNNSQASSLCNQLVGESDGYGAYQSFGDIYLTYQNLTDSMQTEDYERNLELATGIANVDFSADGTAYHREYFISYPDNVLAVRLTADGSSSLDLNVSFPVDNGEAGQVASVISRKLGKDVTYTADAANGLITASGQMQDNQMKLSSALQVVTSGGIAEGEDGQSLDISDTDEVILFVSAGTDYKNEYPAYRTGESDKELAERVQAAVLAAAARGYDAVKDRYLADYQELFGRVSLDLGQLSLTESPRPTDELLAAYKNNSASDAEKRLLEVLLYQYGRYLTIASSREGDLPSNLQGVWQNRVGDAGYIPWGSDYHMNVNLQMNYWPTYSGNLAECATPLIDYVDSLREPGRVTAEAYYGIKSENGEENGFTAHTQNTPFGWTCPGWAFSWGWSPAAVPWILQNCWEYYEYTGDVDYMRDRIYPMLKEEARLYDQLLVDSGVEITLEDGSRSTRLVSAPTYSPEMGPYTLGNVYENTLIWQLYEDASAAADILGVDAELSAQWKETQSRLAPIEIGDSGQIKEWYNETTLGNTSSGAISGYERGHRHMSHLLGLFPGDLISTENEDYIKAAIVSLEDRGYNSTGWGMGQRINAWARTGRGNTAHTLIQSLFNGGIYPNLWDSHAPFQIDGNFGYTSGVNEMLMQSNMGYIHLLPALPDVWSSGSVEGILARGNFELDIQWKDKAVTSAEILSKNGGECIVQYTGIEDAGVRDSTGASIPVKKVADNRISFQTRKGETYTISIDSTPLKNAVAAAEALDLSKYTAASIAASGFEKALADAKAVLADASAKQFRIDAALQELQNAVKALVPIVNSSALSAGIADAEKLVLTDYTAETAAQVQQALADAKATLANTQATQAQVDAALQKLQNAVAGLLKNQPAPPAPNPVKQAPAKGSVISVGNLRYKVTKSGDTNGTVTVSGPTAAGKKKSSLTIPATVTADGFSFKVTAIAKNAFQKNNSLKSITIGSNVTNIGSKAFFNCKKLSKVTFKAKAAPKIGKQAFKETKTSCKIYYPKSMKANALKALKNRIKSAGAGKKVSYKKK